MPASPAFDLLDVGAPFAVEFGELFELGLGDADAERVCAELHAQAQRLEFFVFGADEVDAGDAVDLADEAGAFEQSVSSVVITPPHRR